MTGQLKQRIVGILVLIFLALIILPWLFGNNQSPVFEEKKINQKEKIAADDLPEIVKEPAQTQTPIPDKIDPMPTTETIQAPVAENSYTPPNTNKTNEMPARVTTLNATKITTIENAIVHNNSESKTPVDSLPKQNHPSKVKKTEPEKAHLEKVKATDSHDKNWIVQVGSFSNKTNADKLVQQLKAKGYPVHLKTLKGAGGEITTKVFVGPESNHHAAETVVNKIEKSFKVHSVIVKMKI